VEEAETEEWVPLEWERGVFAKVSFCGWERVRTTLIESVSASTAVPGRSSARKQFFLRRNERNVDNDSRRQRLISLRTQNDKEETMVNTKRYCFAFVDPAQKRVHVSTK
jgi:hypothetical protein